MNHIMGKNTKNVLPKEKKNRERNKKKLIELSYLIIFFKLEIQKKKKIYVIFYLFKC